MEETENLKIDRLWRLAAAFPCMAPLLRVEEDWQWWRAEAIDAWAADAPIHETWPSIRVPTPAQRVTTRFLLAVWDPTTEWKSGKFHLMEALWVWDERHHAAFLRWAERPWWA